MKSILRITAIYYHYFIVTSLVTPPRLGPIAPEGVLWLNPYYILLPSTTITTSLLAVTTKFSLLPIVHLGTWLELLLINASLLPINALTRRSRPGWTMGSNGQFNDFLTTYYFQILSLLHVYFCLLRVFITSYCSSIVPAVLLYCPTCQCHRARHGLSDSSTQRGSSSWHVLLPKYSSWRPLTSSSVATLETWFWSIFQVLLLSESASA